MKVILLTNIPKVGKKDDVKDLKDGFAQNALIAKGLAILATPQSLALLKEKKDKLDKEKDREEQVFLEMIRKINNQKIEIKAKVNEKGHLFKTINSQDISRAIKEKIGIDINEKNIEDVHLKEIGLYQVKIKRQEKSGSCQVEIKKE